MGQLRNFQFLRNGQPATAASHEEAKGAALSAFRGVTTIKDGEMLLYRYTLTTGDDQTTVHTIVGVAHVSETDDKSFEIIANHDMVQAIVATINNQIDALDGRMDTAEGKITTAEGKITTLEGKMTTVEADIDALEGRMTTAESDIDALEGKITTAEGKITTLEGRMTTAESDIDDLQAAIADMDYTHNAANTDNITFKIFAPAQTNGQVSEVEDGTITFNQALSTDNKAATMADVNAAIESTTYEAGNGISISDDNVVSAKVAEGEKVLSVDNNGLKTTIGLNWNSETTEIELVGINNEVIDTIDAKDFVVDGMLSDAEVITATDADHTADSTVVVGDKYIKLTFITKYHDENDETTDVEKVVYVAAKSLVDVYTADNVYLTVTDNKFSHNELHASEKEVGEITMGGNADNIATVEKANDQISFTVPTLTINKAGHVTELDEYKVNITLPESIGTALQGVSATGDTYITAAFGDKDAENKQALTVSAKIGNYTAEGQVDGLATTTATKTYVDSKIQALDDSMTTVDAGAGISVTDAATEGSNDHAYTVTLAEVEVEKTNDTDDYVAANGTHTRVSDITVDNYGRVTAVTKTTVTENWDCGIY